MAVKWTDAQQDAIKATKGTILVSAAAGSGKTAVLVERAIGRLTDPENPTMADRLLIVTFTRAAAAEMRARLEKSLYEMLRNDPSNEILRRQSVLLSQANIGTVHGFCGNLIREFSHQLELSQDFMIITDNQKEQMKADALEEVVAGAYRTDGFKKLADVFSGDRDDSELMKVILKIDEYMQSHPYPEKWMDEMIDMYRVDKLPESPWAKVVIGDVTELLKHARAVFKDALKTVSEEPEFKDNLCAVLLGDISFVEELIYYCGEGKWDTVFYHLKACKFSNFTAPKGFKDHPEKLKAAAMRDRGKKAVKLAQKRMIGSEQDCKEDLAEIAEILAELKKVTFEFSDTYAKKKRERNFLDYSDLEHFAIRLLVDENGNRTEVAKEVSGRYDEIMVDEFQDTNEVQDSIFRSVSKDESNMFVVGDVKQSIYGFRCAMPEIFIRSKESFEKYNREKDSYPAYINLDSNFRSRREVTETVNFIFSQIMSKSTGDIDYNDEEALVYGGGYPEGEGYETELYLLERNPDKEISETESAFIANKIKEIMGSGLTVKDGDSNRPPKYSDFCILIRKANKTAYKYAAELEKYGIPAKSNAPSDFFAAKEIGFAVSLLRVIDNPNQDIPLLSVMLSPVYGFSPEDAALLRTEDKSVSLYISVLRAVDTSPLCKRLIEELAEFRTVAATMPADSFVDFLYERTGYRNIVLAMDNGEKRLANLRLLQKYAADYENSGGGGVSGFVRFFDKLIENKTNIDSAVPADDIDDRVSIMSVHKSKGLGFPICILADCGRSSGGMAKSISLNPNLGIGMKLKNKVNGAKCTTLPRDAILIDNNRRDLAEEQRVLYVALTRAKEKLIMVGTVPKAEKFVEDLASEITEEGLSEYTIKSKGNFISLLTLCALRHPDMAMLRQRFSEDGNISVYNKNYVNWEFDIITEDVKAEMPEYTEAESIGADMAMYEKVYNAVNYVYPFGGLRGIPSKVSASGVAGKEYREENGITLKRPSWLSQKGMTPAERGTALHNFMQYADFESAAKNPAKELERLVENGFLTTPEAEAVDLRHVQRFFENDLGKKVLLSPDVRKERRFTVEIPAVDVIEGLDEEQQEHKVILQGAVDLTFTFEGKIHIIDFKTDRVKTAAELEKPYKDQITLYAKAMAMISGYEVGDLYLYSMYRDDFIKIQQNP